MASTQKKIPLHPVEEGVDLLSSKSRVKTERKKPVEVAAIRSTQGTQAYRRIGRVADLATEVWGNYPDAIDWLSRPNMELKGKAPISLLETRSGEEAVMRLLSALENGFPV